jgi:hypothetical protein
VDFTTAKGVLRLALPNGEVGVEPLEAIHMLESIGDGFPREYKYDRVHAKIAALKFRYSTLESHGEKLKRDTLENDLSALADITDYCVKVG